MAEPNGWYEHPDGRREDVSITITEAADSEWVRTLKSPRPVSIAAWFRLARRGQVWWPGKTFTINVDELPDEYQCCTLTDGHDSPCQWKCSDCYGTGSCVECMGGCECDDVVQCELCDGTEACPLCEDGWIYD